MKEARFIILAAYVLILAFRWALKLVNLGHLKRHGGIVPPGFEGAIDAARLGKTRDYTVEKARLGFVDSAVDSALLVAFLYGGVLDLYNTWVLSLGLPFIVTGLLYFFILSAASTVLGIPFSFYDDFKIENKYGFNTMTWKIWLADLAKSIAVSTLLMAAVGSVSLAIVQLSPALWWLWAWIFFLLFGISFMYVSPCLIEPLFNKYTPVQDRELESKIRGLMEKVGLSVGRVQVVDASRRSRHSNAYFTGIGRVRRIVLFDTLLGSMSHGEILAVLAHEAGHWKKRHVLRRIVLTEIASLAGLFIASRILKSDLLTAVFGIAEPSFFAKLILLGFAGSIILFPFTPLASWMSRRHEREADRFACGVIESREDLAGALVKLSKDNLSNLHPHPLFAAVYYSHPPVLERIRAIRNSG